MVLASMFLYLSQSHLTCSVQTASQKPSTQDRGGVGEQKLMKKTKGCDSAVYCGCSKSGHHPQSFFELESINSGSLGHQFEHLHTQAEVSLPFPAVRQHEFKISGHPCPPFASETLLSHFIIRNNKDWWRHFHITHERSRVCFLGLQH